MSAPQGTDRIATHVESDPMEEAARAADATHRRHLIVAFGAIGSVVLGALAVAGLFVHGHEAGGVPGHEAGEAHGPPQAWQIGILPFVLILLAIAVFPLIGPIAPWWHHNRNKLAISIVAAFATLAYVGATSGAGEVAITAKHALVYDYVPFMTVLFSLFVVSGGIRLQGDLLARPSTTTAFLAAGTAIASFVGTTGAAMLLIRPLLSTIAERTIKVHTMVFFIFLVANIGGSLLPIGDPPLFMGYLRGVPFSWTLTLWQEWLFCSVVLLALHWLIDTVAYSREPISALLEDPLRRTPLSLQGHINLIYLVAIVLTVGSIDPSRPFPGTEWHPFRGLREIILLALSGLSLATTPAGLRKANSFSFFAILEVAAVFLGIFVAMMVPLTVLRTMGDSLRLDTPGHYFWATGILSSFLDNAPTYVVFFEAALTHPIAPGEQAIPVQGGEISGPLLTAISLGAVFMGANSYIGNGPNFMVRSIAEENGVRMPSFFGFMLWSTVILMPLFVLVHYLFV